MEWQAKNCHAFPALLHVFITFSSWFFSLSQNLLLYKPLPNDQDDHTEIKQIILHKFFSNALRVIDATHIQLIQPVKNENLF